MAELLWYDLTTLLVPAKARTGPGKSIIRRRRNVWPMNAWPDAGGTYGHVRTCGFRTFGLLSLLLLLLLCLLLLLPLVLDLLGEPPKWAQVFQCP